MDSEHLPLEGEIATEDEISTEALKGHRELWKIEICYLIRMT